MANHDIYSFLEGTVETILALGWNRAVLMLRNEETDAASPVTAMAGDLELAVQLQATPAEPYGQESWRREDFRISHSYLRLDPAADSAEGTWQAEDRLIVPLETGIDELGWLAVSDPADGQRPSLDQIRALEIIAKQTARTFQRAYQHHQIDHQVIRQTVLNQITHTISQHLEMAELFPALTRQLRQVFNFQRASITLHQEALHYGRVFMLDEHGSAQFETRQPATLEDIASAEIIQRQQPYRIVADLTRSATTPEETRLLAENIRSYVCLPLKVWGQVIGVLTLASETPHAFELTDSGFLIQITDHIAGAVWNAILYDMEQRRHHTADALVQVSQIVNSTLELDQVLTLALEQLAQAVFYDSCSIILTQENNDLVIAACQGFENPDTVIGSVFHSGKNNVAQQVVRSQQVKIVPDVQVIDGWDHWRRDMEGTQTIRSWIGVPLVVRGQSIGLLTLNRLTPGAYTEDDGEMAAAFAAPIATAIFNARLYESEQRRRRQAAALAELARLVNSTLQLDEVLRLALQQIGQVISYDSTSIFLLEGEYLVIAACRGFSQPERLLGMVVHPDEMFAGPETMTRRCMLADVQALRNPLAPEDNPDLYAIRSWIGVPLIVRDRPIGLLTIDKHEVGFYTEEDGVIAEAFADQIASAIYNARLYQATQQQRDRLDAILTDTTDIVIVLDDSNRLWLLNPAAERHLQVSHEQVMGQPIEALGLPALTAALAEACQSKEPVMTQLQGPDDLALHASVAPVHDVGWVVVMQDITPLKDLDQLRTEWVAAVSHDLKNPIQVMQLSAALLAMDGPLNELQRERVDLLLKSSLQLSDLVTNVLDLARVEIGPAHNWAPLVVGDMIMTALSEVRHLAEKKEHSVEIIIAPDLPLLMGDEVLLRRVVVNLVGNAIKYTPDGGQITIQAAQDGASARIDISDNGIGIPSEALPRLYERFYRAPGAIGDGSGLGLSIVKSIIDKHKGSIDIQTEPGIGTTFTVYLPLSA